MFLVGSAIGELAALGLLRARLRRRGERLRDLGWGRRPTASAMAGGLAVALGYILWTAADPSVGAHLFDASGLQLVALPVAVVAGVVEEVVFRGYLMTSLRRMGRGPVVQVVVSAGAFALAHAYAFGGSLSAVVAAQIGTFALGLALALVFVAGRRSLTPVIAAHVLIDLVLEPALLLRVFTLGH